ncbi:cation-translocating P-type ATPase [Nonomuraea cavernae]|uniref:Haloacid dehalogenase n=1 Tax=Nonomuraea cavernae TaxID=2045107 RepID=A0A918DFE3_9ACTN|nr:cation-translocating P-type ATPase [Nonomuraea cavernae]MCA2183663.1 cation-translocating P-type ATPase [Nonomuraea cavernae]GGO60985.1 haloacid dehalogenase [Nonomuraea cavernae]
MASGALDFDPSVVDARTVAESMGTDPERGLTSDEAARRLASAGPNEITSARPVPKWRKFVEQFRDPLIYLLFAAIVISLAAWLIEGAEGWPFDAIVITIIVVLNAILGYWQQAKAEHAVEALQRMSAITATVLRDGVPSRVPTRELVPGDVLVLGEGDTVSADARLLSAATLKISEASLTGESEAVLKDAHTLPEPAALGDRLDMVFNGTAVTQGVGRAVVTATGMATQMGQIADLLHATREDPTPLQREIARVGRMLGIAVIVIAVVVMATIFLFFGVNSVDDVVTALLLGVSLAVAAVPEGLPTILSVVLALGVQRMALHNAIVKKLSSVETLGSASVVCSDKTGTLTKGEMTIGRVVTASGEVMVTGAGYRPEGRMTHDGAPLEEGSVLWRQTAFVLVGGSLANNATLREENGEWLVQGDPTEAAFLVAEAKLGASDRRTSRFQRVGEIPFTSERKMMTSVEADAERAGKLAVVAKGAPDVLLRRCTHVRVGDAAEPLDDARRARVLDDVERLSGEAFRTLGVAYRRLEVTEPPEMDESLEENLVYAGMVGIIDPPRPEAAAAIAEAHRAGVRVIMITGDHPRTAARIAEDLGIVEHEAVAVSGAELDRLDEEGFREIVRHRSVYARVTPHDKLRIVDALQDDRRVVAMTGDGVNDAPALKSADIGIAMGRTGTEVTKEAAKMILADDNFATIVRAIREGRHIFLNIKKFLRYLLSSNMGEVLTVFLGVVLAGVIGLSHGEDTIVLPLLATQILWINLLTDSAPALAMGVDSEIEDVMNHPPRSLRDRVIDRRMWAGVIVIGLAMAVATLATIDLYLPGGLIEGSRSLDNARTAGFTVLVLAQLFNALNARSETGSAFQRLFANPWLWGAIGLSLVLQIAVVHVPFLNTAFTTSPLSFEQWLVCVAMASAVLWVSELRKLILRRAGALPG